MTILSLQHMTIPTNTACHSQFKPNMNIKSADLFHSLSCTPHIALTMDHLVLHNIFISLSFRQHASLPYYFAGLINSNNQLLSSLEEISCHTVTRHTPKTYPHPLLILAVTAALHPPPALIMTKIITRNLKTLYISF